MMCGAEMVECLLMELIVLFNLSWAFIYNRTGSPQCVIETVAILPQG